MQGSARGRSLPAGTLTVYLTSIGVPSAFDRFFVDWRNTYELLDFAIRVLLGSCGRARMGRKAYHVAALTWIKTVRVFADDTVHRTIAPASQNGNIAGGKWGVQDMELPNTSKHVFGNLELHRVD